MAFPRNSLRAFLQYARRSLAQAQNGDQKLNIVIGNESADLDSLSSSLLYAYMRSIAPPRNAFSPIYVPLVNIPASGLRLRPEFTTVCSHANIPISHLITLSDLPDQFKSPENIRWILVDHNKLQGQLGEKYGSLVHGVIDHHDEENAVPQDTVPEPRTIERCGSCTSLVVRYCKSTWDAISSSSLSSGAAHGQGEAAVDDSIVTQGWDAQIAKLALASILIDTANLTAPGKVDQADIEAVEYLEAKVQSSVRDMRFWNRDTYYKEIDKSKKDIESLSLNEILQKDYKQWTENSMNVGVSSVVKPLDFIVKKANLGFGKPAFEHEIDRFMEERELSLFAIMTITTTDEGEFRKELLLQARSIASSSASRFTERAASELKLEKLEIESLPARDMPSSDMLGPWSWVLKDVSKSRKQVAPLLREAMSY